jgi:dCMP deaminase
MDLARHISAWSKDPSTQVGCVIVDPDRKVVGLGFNGFPRGVEDTWERYNDRLAKIPRVVHAEANAILNAGRDLAGCTAYVTLHPCCECAKLLIQSGITVVYAPNDDLPDRWKDSLSMAQEMLRESGVRLELI